MKLPWPLYLAWKQLFPTQKKVSFFSLLAIVGVALGVNVMIVVIAFMQGFQEKFRSDIIDSQGHGRAFAWKNSQNWKIKKEAIENHSSINSASPYIQAHVLLKKDDYNSIPYSMGIDPSEKKPVLQIDSFLKAGILKMNAHDAEDITPYPTIETLDDEVVFISTKVANQLGVRPPTVIRFYDQNQSNSLDRRTVDVLRLDPYVESGEWEVFFKNSDEYVINDLKNEKLILCKVNQGPVDQGFGFPVFELKPHNESYKKGDVFKFHVFKGSSIEVFVPEMIEKAKSDEIIPPREVRVGGIFEVPWQGFHTEAMIGTMRFVQDMLGQSDHIDGFYLKVSDQISRDEKAIAESCKDLENLLGEGWGVLPWFVENAWFFELLKFEEYLMILIMVPIGLVAAFAIAIALMTSVLRKIREIGLLVAMGGRRISVGLVFCLQGFIIGFLGACLGCSLALLFIRFRDELMNFIVRNIAGEDGQAGVSQFYDFYSLEIFYPWESQQSLATFLSFGLFSIFVSTLAGFIPAWRAARLKPADSLRSE